MVGVEFADRGHQAHVALADQVDQREAAVLVFLGDRNDEAEVLRHQLLHGLFVALLHPAGHGQLLLGGEQRGSADVVEVEVQNVPLAASCLPSDAADSRFRVLLLAMNGIDWYGERGTSFA